MSKGGLVELRAEGVSYYSRHDEDCFFHWLGKSVGSLQPV